MKSLHSSPPTTYKGYPQYQRDVKGISVNYAKMGEGPLLVMVPGLTDNWYSMGMMIPFLKDHFTLVIIDLPGYGFSGNLESYSVEIMAEYVIGFCSKLSEKPRAIVGMSMGSLIVGEVGRRVGDEFGDLVLMGPVIKQKSSVWMTMLINMFMKVMGSSTLTRWIPQFIISKRPLAYFMSWYINMYRFKREVVDEFSMGGKKLMRPQAYIDMGISISTYDLKATLLQYTVPALLVYGGQDKVSQADTARDLAAENNLPFTIKEVDEAAHWVIADQPEIVSQHIIEYLS